MNKNFLYATIIFVALIFSGGLKGFRSQSKKSISVTGMAERNFQSDLIVWSASFRAESSDLPMAYSQLKEQREAVASFLKGKNVPADAIACSSISISREMDRY